MIVRIISLFAVLLCCTLVLGQESTPRFNHLNMDDGLSNDRVNCIVQDQRGYLWIGTNDGLNRYDGRQFIVYRKAEGTNSVCGNSISQLEIDENGIIWVGTNDGGLCSLDPVAVHFRNYPIKEQFPLSTDRVMSLTIKNPETVYVGFEKFEMVELDVPSAQFRRFNQSSHATTFYSLHFSQRSQRLYHSPIHFGLRWMKGDSIHSFKDRPTDSQYPGYTMNTILESRSGDIYCGAWDNALHHFDPKSGIHDYHVLDGGDIAYNTNEIQSLAEDQMGRLWVGTRFDGLWLFDSQRKTFQKVRSQINDQGSARGKDIEAIFRDAQDRIWVGSEEGISVYDPLLNQFDIHWIEGRENETTRAFQMLGDTLLIGCTDGLTLVVHEQQTHKPLFHQGKKLSVSHFYMDHKQRLFLGTNKSVFQWDRKNQQLESNLNFSKPVFGRYLDIASSYVSDVVEYRVGAENYLLAFYFGYDLLVIDEGDFHATPNHLGRGRHYENLVRRLKVDTKGRLWALGSSKGLLEVVDPFLTDSIRSADHPPSQFLGHSYFLKTKGYLGLGATGFQLGCPDLSDMVEDPDGTFWITTHGGGLVHFDSENDVEMFADMKSPVSNLGSAVLTNSGELWISCSTGLLRYDISNNEFRHFGKRDGIPSSGTSGRPYVDAEGNIYVGGKGFYIKFHPSDMEKNDAVAHNHLDALMINGQVRDMNSSEVKSLSHQENFMSFLFSSPNLTDPSLNRFEYRLDGLEDKWNAVSGQVKADYTSLPAGDYQFQVRSSNNDGRWNEVQTLHNFSISPPWWKTWWFYSLMLVTVASIVYGLYTYRISQIRKLYEVRDTIARDLHDDIGSTLGSISMYSQVAKNKLEDSGNAEEVIDMIGETSRNMMDRVGDIVWAVNPKNDGLDHLVTRMKNYAAPILKAKQIDFLFDFDDRFNDIKLSMVQRKNLFLIFKECIHNAVKYADCKSIIVELKEMNREIRFRVTDDGRGFDPESMHAYNGNGLMNIKERGKDLGADVKIQSALGEGCSVSLVISQ